MLLPSRSLETKGATQRFAVDLLPELPPAWPNGSVTGLRARAVSQLIWPGTEGELQNALFRSSISQKVAVRYADRVGKIKMKHDRPVRLNSELQEIADASKAVIS